MYLPDKTEVELSPCQVTYRRKVNFSTVIVTVNLSSWDDPRITAYFIDSTGRGPITLFFSELLFYIHDAKERLVT